MLILMQVIEIVQKIFFSSFGITKHVLCNCENTVQFKMQLDVMNSLAFTITGHEQTKLNLVCYFWFTDIFFSSSGVFLTHCAR